MIEKVKGLSICGRCFSKKTNLTFFPNDNDRIAIPASYLEQREKVSQEIKTLVQLSTFMPGPACCSLFVMNTKFKSGQPYH